MNQMRQGDVYLRKVDEIPEGLEEQTPENDRHVLAHSETGHHHWVQAGMTKVFRDREGTQCYLMATSDTELLHDRSYHTHAPIDIVGGTCYKVVRQREDSPLGPRYVQD